jgi:hypothetical protein
MKKRNWNDDHDSDDSDENQEGSGEISEQNTPELKGEKETKMKFEESKESESMNQS